MTTKRIIQQRKSIARDVMKIEFAILWEDYTWNTTIEDVPFTEDVQLDVIEIWARTHLLARPEFRKAVLSVIYNDNPEEEQNDST